MAWESNNYYGAPAEIARKMIETYLENAKSAENMASDPDVSPTSPVTVRKAALEAASVALEKAAGADSIDEASRWTQVAVHAATIVSTLALEIQLGHNYGPFAGGVYEETD